jgi:hypothetical protein
MHSATGDSKEGSKQTASMDRQIGVELGAEASAKSSDGTKVEVSVKKIAGVKPSAPSRDEAKRKQQEDEGWRALWRTQNLYADMRSSHELALDWAQRRADRAEHELARIVEQHLARSPVHNAAAVVVSDSIIAPKPFTAKGADVDGEAWLEYFEHYAAHRQLSEEHELSIFKLLMREAAADWLSTVPGNVQSSYESCGKHLKLTASARENCDGRIQACYGVSRKSEDWSALSMSQSLLFRGPYRGHLCGLLWPVGPSGRHLQRQEVRRRQRRCNPLSWCTSCLKTIIRVSLAVTGLNGTYGQLTVARIVRQNAASVDNFLRSACSDATNRGRRVVGLTPGRRGGRAKKERNNKNILHIYLNSD